MLGISVTELRDLVVSLIALVIAFSVLFGGAVLDMNMIIVSTLGVASGFLLHELAHKFTAQHFGYLAEYRANLLGLGLAVASAFAGLLIAAPGAVMISRSSPLSKHIFKIASMALPSPIRFIRRSWPAS